ncbi:MAG: glycosyltransferase [Candidatus Omnitrophota bacterium]|nr:glycosyltransferase [Candidatus Omnitrophota bacterium]
MQGLVSIIMAVKNGERYLSKAIESVVCSPYRPIEIIVVDGQSSDSTPRIAQSFETVRYILQENTGIADAYNVGIEASRGEFIGFLSCDDEWDPDKLTLQVSYLINNPAVYGTVSKVKFFLEEGCTMPRSFRAELLRENPAAFIMETLLVRKTVFDIVGKFNTQYAVAEDVDWFARAKDKHIDIAVIPHVLLAKRIHDRNASLHCVENSKYLLTILRQSIERGRHKE